MLKIFINGLSGKMGQSVSKIANDKNYIISNTIESCDLVIDFSHPNNLSEMLKSSIKFNKPIIIGTTGFSKQQFKTIEKAAQEIPIMCSSNFSDGVLNLKKTIESFIKNSSESFNCEIEETHHTEKIDFPSGTAIDLRNFIMSVDKKNIVIWGGNGKELTLNNLDSHASVNAFFLTKYLSPYYNIFNINKI